MAKRIGASAAALTVALPLLLKASASLPPPAYGDGCSGGMSWFYRHALGKIPVWESCCVTHDRAYGPGGTSDQRAAADGGLYACVAESGHPLTAGVMWIAVRLGGTPLFPFGWRWGFERDYGVSWWYARSGAE